MYQTKTYERYLSVRSIHNPTLDDLVPIGSIIQVWLDSRETSTNLTSIFTLLDPKLDHTAYNVLSCLIDNKNWESFCELNLPKTQQIRISTWINSLNARSFFLFFQVVIFASFVAIRHGVFPSSTLILSNSICLFHVVFRIGGGTSDKEIWYLLNGNNL